MLNIQPAGHMKSAINVVMYYCPLSYVYLSLHQPIGWARELRVIVFVLYELATFHQVSSGFMNKEPH
jgi:hypothetical protein